MKLAPQAQKVLKHLQLKGSISGVEAEAIYQVRHLPRRIADLKESGHAIEGRWMLDPTKQRYKRYHLKQKAAK